MYISTTMTKLISLLIICGVRLPLVPYHGNNLKEKMILVFVSQILDIRVESTNVSTSY